MRTMCVAGAAAVVALMGWIKFAASAEGPPISEISSVYTANANSSDVSALDASSLGRSVPDISGPEAPGCISVSHDGTRVYTGAIDGEVWVIDATTDSVVSAVTADPVNAVADLVVSPDDSTVYATISNSGTIAKIDAVALNRNTTFPVPALASNSPRPTAIDISPDGAFLFVLNSGDSRVVKLNAATGASASPGAVAVSPNSLELKVSTDGATFIVVGSDGPQFFSTATLAPISGAASDDLGSQVDVAVAGANFYVLNQALVTAQAVNKGGPKFAPISGPSIDVYDAPTGHFVQSIMLASGLSVNGITVLSDGTQAFVSSTGSENAGSVTAVNLTTGASGTTGSTGSNPVRVAVREFVQATPVVSYFLPRIVVVKLKGEGKDTLIASGFFDEGGFTPDYDQDVTITVGGFTSTFKLLANKNRTSFKNIQNAGTVRFGIVPNLRHSSRGRFTMKLFKTTLAGLIDPNLPVEFHFQATGLPDAQGKVQLQKGTYRLNHTRGELFEPLFFPASVKSKLGAQGKDTLLFKGGFATTGGIPDHLAGTVRFGFGPTFVRAFDPSLFVKNKAGNTFKYVQRVGKTTVSISIDFLKEIVTVSAKNVELGTLDDATVDVLFDAGGGDAGATRETIRVSKVGSTQRNY